MSALQRAFQKEDASIMSRQECVTELRNTLASLKNASAQVSGAIEKAIESAIAAGKSSLGVDKKQVELDCFKAMETRIYDASNLVVRYYESHKMHTAASCPDCQVSSAVDCLSVDVSEYFNGLVDVFTTMPKARTAKILRDITTRVPELNIQLQFIHSAIAWCELEGRTFLRVRMQTRLCTLLYEKKDYRAGLQLVSQLINEVKLNLDDKLLLVELFLLQSKFEFSTRNLTKARGSLTAAKTNANSLNCPPHLQAELDLVAGRLHADGDLRTAYSYFFESFEAYSMLKDIEHTIVALNYMSLIKLMIGADASSDGTLRMHRKQLPSTITDHPDYIAFQQIADAYANVVNNEAQTNAEFGTVVTKAPLHSFNELLDREDIKAYIQTDDFLAQQINIAASGLLKKAIAKCLEPYVEVEISYVAESKLHLPTSLVESTLSQMILDGEIVGILDQQRGCYIAKDEDTSNARLLSESIAVLTELTEIVDYIASQEAVLV